MTEQQKRTERNSGIELLRIVAMLLIIAHHFALHTEWPEVGSMTFNAYYIELLKSFGKIGAAIFFIISGYFIAKSSKNTFSYKRLLKTASPTWFYSIVILIISMLLGYNTSISLPLDPNLLKSFLPILSSSYWFISQYIVLEIVTPYIKKITDTLSYKELFKLLIIYTTACWGAGTLSYFISDHYAPIITMPSSIIYAILGIAISKAENKFKNTKSLLFILLPSLALIVAPFLLSFLSNHGYTNTNNLFWQFDSPICIIIAASMFVIFKNIKLKSRVINIIASTTLGVYLIHDNIFIRQLLWNSGRIVDIQSHIFDGKIQFILFSIATILGTFIVCSVIEMLRSQISKRISKSINKIAKSCNSVLCK